MALVKFHFLPVQNNAFSDEYIRFLYVCIVQTYKHVHPLNPYSKYRYKRYLISIDKHIIKILEYIIELPPGMIKDTLGRLDEQSLPHTNYLYDTLREAFRHSGIIGLFWLITLNNSFTLEQCTDILNFLKIVFPRMYRAIKRATYNKYLYNINDNYHLVVSDPEILYSLFPILKTVKNMVLDAARNFVEKAYNPRPPYGVMFLKLLKKMEDDGIVVNID